MADKTPKNAQLNDVDAYRLKKTHPALKVLIYIFLAIWTFVNLYPLFWMFTFSLKSNEEIYGLNVAGLPTKWLWSNYPEALKTGHMPRYFFNSIVITVLAMAITLIAALMATYALTRIKWRGSKLMNSIFMLGLTIPLHASILPVYLILSKLHWLNSYQALIIPYSAFSLAMAILICTGFMVDIPKDLDEAAYIDGCGMWGTFIKVILPLTKPAFATIGIYSFLQSWNELMFANIFNSKGELKTIPVGIQSFQGQYLTDWGLVGAVLVMATFPTLLAYVFLSKRIQSSFIAGAVKG
ncbi:MAG: carbohydrate ABC transporter permease [Lachnospiraceae bacterium]|nr:carbohydrate ABC transporter permease [Lachnospiraceae bacterium]